MPRRHFTRFALLAVCATPLLLGGCTVYDYDDDGYSYGRGYDDDEEYHHGGYGAYRVDRDPPRIIYRDSYGRPVYGYDDYGRPVYSPRVYVDRRPVIVTPPPARRPVIVVPPANRPNPPAAQPAPVPRESPRPSWGTLDSPRAPAASAPPVVTPAPGGGAMGRLPDAPRSAPPPASAPSSEPAEESPKREAPQPIPQGGGSMGTL